ncbi:MAG: hypothetical protein OXN15_05870 [Chloroflexota bacterium]|nr:hypothetical protein [Chloroflexota bacterium]MDE2969673.1 hypothetical protein [Chloroflexota bacterium]
MRTTLTIDNDIVDSLKERARLQGRPFKQVVNDALRRGLSQTSEEERPEFRVEPMEGGILPHLKHLTPKEILDELSIQDYLEKEARSEKNTG